MLRSRLLLASIALTTLMILPGQVVGSVLTSPIHLEYIGPRVIPEGAGVDRLMFRVLNPDGTVDETNSESVAVGGLLVRPRTASTNTQLIPFTAKAAFHAGVVTITPESLDVQQLSISDQGLSVESEGIQKRFKVAQRFSWWRLLPPIIAIAIAVLLKDVTVALIVATLSGCLLFYPATDVPSIVSMFCDTMVAQIADSDHASVILFTLLLGAMIGLMNDSGGTRSAIDRLARVASTRRKGMTLTWLMGLIIFFDDYANTMLIGGAMRPLSDRLKFSRAKLAYLIDSTAAPVAGMAISTWTAFEIDQIAAGFSAAGIEGDAGRFFWSTIPFRIYPILTIAFVAAVAISGRDFGLMLRHERGEHDTPETTPSDAPVDHFGSTWLAVVPVAVLVTITVLGFLNDTDAYRLLLVASFAASSSAFVLPLLTRTMTLDECARSWSTGIASMIPAVTILVLAWAVSAVCSPDRLDTAGLIISAVGDSVRPEFLPTLAFVTAGAIAVAIGSSFTTMALLMPLFIPLAWSLLGESSGQGIADPIFGATVGAILAGAIFGDHCSPISDTTILSSAAAGCDHLQHVGTQFPYALLTAVASVLLGYLPIGWGIPWWICLPVGMTASVGGLMLLGKPASRPRIRS